MLIFAGAGSGKTRALTYRIAYMIQEKDIPPDQILAVTFTNRAAGEMKERIERLVGEDAAGIWAGTFHSICCRILRQYGEAIGVPHNFVIYDEAQQKTLLKEALNIMDFDSKEYTPSQIKNSISSGKNELLDVQGFSRTRKGPFEEFVARVYSNYQERLRSNNALDFDDLIKKAVELLETKPEVLGKLHDRLRYILVDEYQDINHAQYRLIQLLSRRHNNICVVGDDDQSIYGWRGANVGIILAFQNDFPEATVVKLEQNYRSTECILECAHEVIRHNPDRADKKLWTDGAVGDKPVIYQAVSEEEEAKWVANIIARQVRNGEARYGDYAVLYRTNAMSRVLEFAFRDRGIPYEIVGGMSFYDRSEVKDAAAYLSVLFNPQDSMSLRRIINTPTRGIGDATVGHLTRLASSEDTTLLEACRLAAGDPELREAQRNAVIDFYEMMTQLQQEAEDLDIGALLKRVLERSGYIDSLESSSRAEDADRLDNLEELVTDAVKYEQNTEEASLAGFLERLALLADIDEADDLDSSVSLMTLHSAKGLEFPIVFIVGLEEGIFPHERSMGDEFEIAEERRLCYVGITRAERMLYMSHAKGRTIFGQPRRQKPSRFLKDLPEHLVVEKVPYDTPLSPRMFGDEEAAQQQAEKSDFDLDMTEILQRARENEKEAQRRQDKKEAERSEKKTTQPKQAKPTPKKRKKRKKPSGARSKSSRKKSPESSVPDEFYEGAKIEHEDFGRGIIVTVQNADIPQLTVAFPEKGLKKLLADHPKLKLVE